MKSLLLLVLAVLAISCNGQITYPSAALNYGYGSCLVPSTPEALAASKDVSIWANLWKRPRHGVLVTFASQPIFSALVNNLSNVSPNSKYTFFASTNKGILRAWLEFIKVINERSKAEPDNAVLRGYLQTVPVLYKFFNNMTNDIEAVCAPGDDECLIQDQNMMRQHFNKMCSYFDALTGLVKSNPSLMNLNSEWDVRCMQSQALYHLLNGTIMAENIPEGNSYYSTFATDPLFSQLGAISSGQIVHVKKTIEEGIPVLQLNQHVWPRLLFSPKMLTSNIMASNGVMHVIDSVIALPTNITDQYKNWKLFNKLYVTNVAGILPTLQNLRGITILAPSEQAIDQFAVGQLGSVGTQALLSTSLSEPVMNLSPELLQKVVPDHIITGVYSSSDFKKMVGQCLKSITGKNICITMNGANVNVGGSRILVPDTLISNGVIHYVNKVLLPSPSALY